MRLSRLIVATAAILTLAPAAAARESLGMFGLWGAFRDAEVPRCYAIATPPGPNASSGAYVTVSWWPRAGVSGQFHARFARSLDDDYPVMLAVGEERLRLRVSGRDAWARSVADDRRIVSAMRNNRHLGIAARASGGAQLTQGWSLRGAASALDAAALGCAGDR